MGKKSDAREARKALQLAKFEQGKLALLEKVTVDLQPKVVLEVDVAVAPKVAPHIARAVAEAARQPKAIADGSRFDSSVTWCTTKADQVGGWSWGEPRAWSTAEWDATISPAFNEFANMTWREVDTFSSESGHKMHHSHEMADLTKEAQTRWIELNLEQFDTVFRFRLGGTRRAWGYVAQAHFHMVWWERLHRIYPT
ncbi:MAG: hypothetical protein K2X80_07470 [Pseudomonadaceae bacterium]|nr:hypothetical protein [Pseudomonadaceae bacterium]